VCFMLRLFAADDRVPSADMLQTISSILTWIFRLHPSFCLGKGLLHVLNYNIILDLEENDATSSALSPPILLFELVFLLLQSVFYFLGAVWLDNILARYVEDCCRAYNLISLVCILAEKGMFLTHFLTLYISIPVVRSNLNLSKPRKLYPILMLNESKLG
jgi:hypothetical protein